MTIGSFGGPQRVRHCSGDDTSVPGRLSVLTIVGNKRWQAHRHGPYGCRGASGVIPGSVAK